MSQELVYTSAPRGLKPGSRGFCSVAWTQGIPPQLVERLEALSGYRQVYAPQDPNAALNPVAYSHLRISAGGRQWQVVSRVAAYGLDYTQRTNKFAHHVALEPAEMPVAGPGWLLAAPGFMRTSYAGEPAVLPTARPIPRGNSSPAICRAWQAATGDAGWGGVLAQSALDVQPRPATIIFRAGTDLLPLVAESLALLPPERRAAVTFCTYFTKLPPGVDCRWRGVLDGTPEAAAARRAAQGLVIDLCNPLPRAADSAFVEAARRGTTPAIVGGGVPSIGATPTATSGGVGEDALLEELLGPPIGAERPPSSSLGSSPPTHDSYELARPPLPRSAAAFAEPFASESRLHGTGDVSRRTQFLAIAGSIVLLAGLGVAAWAFFSRGEPGPEAIASTMTAKPEAKQQADPPKSSAVVQTHVEHQPASKPPNEAREKPVDPREAAIEAFVRDKRPFLDQKRLEQFKTAYDELLNNFPKAASDQKIKPLKDTYDNAYAAQKTAIDSLAKIKLPASKTNIAEIRAKLTVAEIYPDLKDRAEITPYRQAVSNYDALQKLQNNIPISFELPKDSEQHLLAHGDWTKVAKFKITLLQAPKISTVGPFEIDNPEALVRTVVLKQPTAPQIAAINPTNSGLMFQCQQNTENIRHNLRNCTLKIESAQFDAPHYVQLRQPIGSREPLKLPVEAQKTNDELVIPLADKLVPDDLPDTTKLEWTLEYNGTKYPFAPIPASSPTKWMGNADIEGVAFKLSWLRSKPGIVTIAFNNLDTAHKKFQDIVSYLANITKELARVEEDRKKEAAEPKMDAPEHSAWAAKHKELAAKSTSIPKQITATNKVIEVLSSTVLIAKMTLEIPDSHPLVILETPSPASIKPTISEKAAKGK